ncbi:MAG: acetyltransferase, partial [Erysipelotrichaceae bacterium]|nr:acetyltransferase [Erysipelotrichaceae bacterium]
YDHIGSMTWIGAGATVSNKISICSNCMIGAGAVVVKNITEEGTYVGVPAKKIR